MEKISRILPSSARVVAADVADAQPARPGAPAFGRPMGKNSLGDRLTLSKQALESQMTGMPPKPEPAATYRNPAESSRAKVVEKLAQDFFNPKIEARGAETTKSQEILKEVQDTEELSMAPITEKELAPAKTRVLRES